MKVRSTTQDAADRKSTILQYIEKKMDKELYRLYGIIFEFNRAVVGRLMDQYPVILVYVDYCRRYFQQFEHS